MNQYQSTTTSTTVIYRDSVHKHNRLFDGERPMSSGNVNVSDLLMEFDSGNNSTTAIEDLSLEVDSGEFVTVVGSSGCGKSTLLYLIAGFLSPTAGEIEVDGDPIDAPAPDRGVVFQEYALFPWRTVLENVTYGLEEQGVPREKRHEKARRYIGMMDLDGAENKYPKELSGGMKQRVALARTLVTDPKILLMDEPFGALDQPLRESLQDHLLDIWREVEKTVIFVTHQVEEAAYLSERVVVLGGSPGRVVTEIDVDLDRTADRSEIVTSEKYNETCRQIRDTIRTEADY